MLPRSNLRGTPALGWEQIQPLPLPRQHRGLKLPEGMRMARRKSKDAFFVLQLVLLSFFPLASFSIQYQLEQCTAQNQEIWSQTSQVQVLLTTSYLCQLLSASFSSCVKFLDLGYPSFSTAVVRIKWLIWVVHFYGNWTIVSTQ